MWQRKKYQVVYLKEGSQIVDILNIMEAHVALMNLENVRILKEMRNSVNRKVNCETANISKTVNAAVKQLADIEYIRETGRLVISAGESQRDGTASAGIPGCAACRTGNLPESSCGKIRCESQASQNQRDGRQPPAADSVRCKLKSEDGRMQ